MIYEIKLAPMYSVTLSRQPLPHDSDGLSAYPTIPRKFIGHMLRKLQSALKKKESRNTKSYNKPIRYCKIERVSGLNCVCHCELIYEAVCR